MAKKRAKTSRKLPAQIEGLVLQLTYGLCGDNSLIKPQVRAALRTIAKAALQAR